MITTKYDILLFDEICCIVAKILKELSFVKNVKIFSGHFEILSNGGNIRRYFCFDVQTLILFSSDFLRFHRSLLILYLKTKYPIILKPTKNVNKLTTSIQNTPLSKSSSSRNLMGYLK